MPSPTFLLSLLLAFAPLSTLLPAQGWLGIRPSEDGTTTVSEVVPGSPAAKAGILVDDRITSIDGKEIATVEQLAATIGKLAAGTPLRLGIARGEKKLELDVRLAARPDAEADDVDPAPARTPIPARRDPVPAAPPPGDVGVEGLAGRPYLGAEIEETSSGVTVVGVKPSGPAARAGLQAGDRLLRLGNQRIQTFAALDAALARVQIGERVTVQVQRGGKRQRVRVVLGARPDLPVAPAPAAPAPAAPAPIAQTEAAQTEAAQTEIEQLRAEVAELRRQQAQLRQQLESLREEVRQR